MRFRTVHKLATYLMVASALGALAFGGNLEGPILLFVLAATVVSALLPEGRQTSTFWQTAWTVGTFLALGLCVLEFLLRNELVIATVNFLLFLLVNKLFNRRAGRDYLQLYVITFMMVVAGSVLNIGVSFAFWFVVYIISTTWSLILFHLRREMEENYLIKHSTDQQSERVAVDRILNSRRIVGGSFLFGTSVVSLTVFVLAIGVFLFFPRLDSQLAMGRGKRAKFVTGFSERLSLGGHGRLRDNPDIVMRIYLRNLPTGVPITGLHWRGVAFDRYAEGKWYRSDNAPRPRVQKLGRHLRMGWQTRPGRPPHRLTRFREILNSATRQEVYQEPIGADLMFSAGNPLAIDVREKSGVKKPQFRVGPGGELRANLAGKGGRYVIWTTLEPPSRTQLLTSRSDVVHPRIKAHYARLPTQLPVKVLLLGRSLTRAKPQRLVQVESVMRYLKQNYRYSRQLRRPRNEDPIAYFLFDRKAGHCEYFASAMVLLLRSGGVPARVVTGFLGGAYNPYGEYVVVRQGDAHAWVEVWFEDVGWVTFDPTPPAGLLPAPMTSRWDRVQMFFDSLRMRWQRWVIDYDLNRQIGLFQSVRGSLSRLKARASRAVAGRGALFGGVALSLALGWILLYAWRRRRRRRQEDDDGLPGSRKGTGRLTRVVVRWVRGLSRLGLPRQPGETLRELATRLDTRVPELSPSAASQVSRYYRLRYAGRPATPEDLGELERAFTTLLSAVRERKAEITAGTPAAATPTPSAAPDHPLPRPARADIVDDEGPHRAGKDS